MITIIISINESGVKHNQLLASPQLKLLGAETVARDLNSVVFHRHLLMYFTEK